MPDTRCRISGKENVATLSEISRKDATNKIIKLDYY
jgi:hypothetical protein